MNQHDGEDEGKMDFSSAFQWQAYREYHKLLAEPGMRIPCVGDHVVIASGLLGMGMPWTRMEALVTQVGQTSYKIKLEVPNFLAQLIAVPPDGIWIHPCLVTDVLT